MSSNINTNDLFLKRFAEIHPLSTMGPKERDIVWETIATDLLELSRRGNYHAVAMDNAQYLRKWVFSHDLLGEERNDPARLQFMQKYWPSIAILNFEFHSLADFKTFHLPYAEMYVSRGCTFDFRDHSKCRGIGCDVCELIYRIDQQMEWIDGGLEAKLAERHSKGLDGCCFSIQTKFGASFEVKGEWRKRVRSNGWGEETESSEGAVTRLRVQGPAHLLDWDPLDKGWYWENQRWLRRNGDVFFGIGSGTREFWEL